MSELNEKLTAIYAERRQPLEVECYEFLIEEGIKFPEYHYVRNEKEMAAILDILESDAHPSYVFKVMSPKILHKSDFKAVHLNVTDEVLMDKFLDLQERFKPLDFRGVLIVPMASEGVELLIGSTFDPTFGLTSVFRVGGTMVEVVNDVTFGKPPISRADALSMINSLKLQKYLNGPRGLPPLDKIAMVDFMVKLSEIACKYKYLIKEIDLNPIRITSNGIYPLDARIILFSETC
ncbi:MAG: acetate--CoA ligase family protein [Candidatus Heimdallarchaeota archaeon]|nr:acetate--CoA ligase family protein [Candidatus Heimdallarchaeota archaeon]